MPQNSYAQSRLSFDANLGLGEMDSIELVTSDSIALPLSDFSCFGCHFVEWNTEADGSGVSFNPMDSFSVSYIDTFITDTVLYAQWGKYCGGNGTLSSPWLICSSEALILLSQSSGDWDKCFILSDNIQFPTDASSIDWNANGIVGDINDLRGFNPIGNTASSFTGMFVGQGHSIDNIYINNDVDYTGLFGLVDSAFIGLITLRDAEVNGYNYIGGVVGRAQNKTTLVGLHFDGLVNGRGFAGGLTGSLENSDIKRSVFMGDLRASGSMVGGLSGRVSSSSISNSYSTGYVAGELQNVGGIAGFVQDNTYITNTYSTAGVVGQKYVGSFAGILSGSKVECCYASGLAMGQDFVGGFMGINGSSTLIDCYYDSETTWSNAAITPGLRAIKKKGFADKIQNFNLWHFGAIDNKPWVHSSEGRPYLYWQKVALSNGLMLNASDGYHLGNTVINDDNNLMTEAGVRYMRIGDTQWTYINDSVSTISNLTKDDYLVQSYAKGNASSHYGDMTLMAIRSLSFDSNGGFGMMSDTLLSSNDSISVPKNHFSLLGYNFLEWSTKVDSSGNVFSDSSQFAIGLEDTTLYALWTARDFIIDYHLYGGENCVHNSDTYTVDSIIVLNDATRLGYSFGGWFADDSFKISVDSISLACTQDTTLYAKWDINTCSIIYHANNGSDLSLMDSAIFGDTVNLSENSFLCDKHCFINWTSSVDGGTSYDNNELYVYGDSTLHLYAQWQKYCGGQGTIDEPWEISSPEALVLLSQSPEDWDKHFIQTADVIFNDSTSYVDWNGDGMTNDSLGFSPIGNDTLAFSGKYYGCNFTIENLYINRPLQDNVGLFAFATCDTLKEIALVNVNITGGDNTGALLGNSAVDTIYNCYSNGIVRGKKNVGGLIGQSDSLNLKNSYSTCAVIGIQHAAGLLGSCSNANIDNCYSSGVVIGQSDCAGFVGQATTTLFMNCYYDSETSQQNASMAYSEMPGIIALSTEDFKSNSSFGGWNIGIGIEIFPWLPNESGRPYLVGQKGTVSNGIMVNSFDGYKLSHAYVDSLSFNPEQTGIRYQIIGDSLWHYTYEVYNLGQLNSRLSGLANGDYLVQAFGQSADTLIYGDMTLMSLSTLHFDANGGVGTMDDTTLVVGNDIYFPTNKFHNNGLVHKEWNTKADGSGFSFSPLEQFSIGLNDTTLYSIWMDPYATDDYFDGIVGGATVEIDVTHNDTIGGIPYGATFPIEIITTSTFAEISIEGNQVIYSPDLSFSGPDFFSYLVEYNGAIDTAEVVVLVFDAPGNMVNADCYVQMPKYKWEVESAGQSPEADISVYNTPLVGNLFGDDFPEVVAVMDDNIGDWSTSTEVAVYTGNSNVLQGGRNVITGIPTFNAGATPMAIAKIETSTGVFQPTLFIADTDRRINAYNPEDGALYWRSSSSELYCPELGDKEGAFLGVADFNNDSKQEVYAANSIYDAETGALLCSGTASADIGHFKYGVTTSEDYSNPTHHMMLSVTGDFDRDGDLELAAGRYVYDVDIANGTMHPMAILPNTLSADNNMIADGATTVADIDLDGDLDVIVTHQTTRWDFYCYVWDGQTPTLIAEKYIRNDFADTEAGRYGVGVPFVGDLNGDGKPEIAFTTSNRQYAFTYNESSNVLQEYYTLSHTDRSGFTGLTLFDFNNDDIAEIVYRDETDLRIINASGISHTTGVDTLNADGTPILYNLATYACESGTQGEFAVVVDVDLDNQAEIIVTNSANGNRLNVFESGSSSKWVAARPVWNQYGYNVTNVNNDLTIPRYSINNSMAIEVDSTYTVRPFNHFLQQMGNVTLKGENVILTPDLYMSNSFYTNDGTTGTLTFDIVNQGDVDFKKQDSTVSFYCGDPNFGGTLLFVAGIQEDIPWEDTLKSVSYTFPANPATCPRVFVRLNDNGDSSFPNIEHIQQECNYNNNTMLAAIFELSSHFTWNGYDLDSVIINTGDISTVDGMVHMLISRGDTLDILPHLDGYVFKPNSSSLPDYIMHNDTLTLQNVQENGTVSFTAYKIPETVFRPMSVVYDQAQHGGDVTVSSSVSSEVYYKNSNDTVWTSSRPDSVGYYDMKVVSEGNYLYTAYADSIDSILVITPRPVSFSLNVLDKPYDASDSIISFSSTNDVINGDSVVLDISNENLYFAGIHSGMHNIVPSDNWSISGSDINNYVLLPYDTIQREILKHTLTIYVNDSTKFYDGTHFTGGSGVIFDGFAVDEDASVLEGSLNYVESASAQGALDQGSYTIAVDGFTSDNYDIVYVDGILTIEKKFLFIEFNGTGVMTYGDSINLMDYESPSVVNLAPGDSFIHEALGLKKDLSSTGNLVVGLHKLDIGDASVINQDGENVTSNYNISFSPENVTILPKELFIQDAIAESKVYDATTVASITGATLAGVITGDEVTLENSTVGQFIQTDVGSDIEIFHENTVEIMGSDASNYILMPFNSSLSANIYPKELLLSGTYADDKFYDGDSIAVVRGSILEGIIGSDDVYLLNDSTGQFAQANVGNGLSVMTAITMTGSKSHNYYLTQDMDLQANIMPTPLLITARDLVKTYDGQLFRGGNGIVWDGFVFGENTTDLSGELSYGGNSQAALDTGKYQIMPYGYSSSNYDITYEEGILNILPRIIDINFSGEDTLIYGAISSTDNYMPTVDNLATTDSIALGLSGFDTDISSSGYLNVGDRNVSTKDVNIWHALYGEVTHNYSFITADQELTIIPRDLIVVNAIAQDKVYDNTVAAIIDSAILSGLVLGDDVTLSKHTSGTFNDENVAENIVVTADEMTISGVDVNNYNFIQPSLLVANITPKQLFIEAVDTTKIYDSFHFSGGNGIVWDGFVAGEDFSDLSGAINYTGTSQMAIDTGYYDITPGGYTSNNYDISYVSSSLRINPRHMYINYGGPDTIMYSNTVDMMNYSPRTSDLAVNDNFYNDFLSFGADLSSSGHYIAGEHDLQIGEAYILNTLGDTVTYNYIFTFNLPSIYINRTPLSIINAEAENKVYDNTTNAVVSGAVLSGVVAGDNVFLSNSNKGIFEDENVASNLAVSTDSMLLYGADTMNYILSSQPILMADITPRYVEYTLDKVEDKTYDGSDSIVNVVTANTNDTIYDDGISLDFNLKLSAADAAQDIAVDATQWQLAGGPEMSNYILLPYAGDIASINKADLTFTVSDVNRFYGQSNGSLDYEIDGYVNNENVSVLDKLPTISCDLTPKTFVGNYQDVIQLSGGYDNNYNYLFEQGEVMISKVKVHVNYMSEDTLIYGDFVDGDDYTVDEGQMENNDSLYLGTLYFGNDTSGSGHYNVGLHIITPGEIRARNQNGNVDVTENYEITFHPTFITYIPKPVYIDVEAKNKTYDGTTTAQLSFNEILDVYEGDDVDLDRVGSDVISTKSETVLNADFSDKNAADQKAVSPISCTFNGADRRNYEIAIPDLEANISPKKITWYGAAFDKVYDGTGLVSIDTVGLNGIVITDDVKVSYSAASFSQIDAGTNVSISLSDMHISGEDEENYILNNAYDLRATIHKAELEIRPNDIEYVYGDAIPKVDLNYSGLVNNETMDVVDEQPELISELNSKSDVGFYPLVIDNAKDNNYNISYVLGQITVLPRPLDITYNCPEKICANNPLDLSTYVVDNLVIGDDLSTLDLDVSTVEDLNLTSGKKYHVKRGRTIVRNEKRKKVTDNYIVNMDPVEIEILNIPAPALGENLEFCGICEYDFDAGEGESYLWSTGDTTRYMSMQGNYRGNVWVRVRNADNCYNTDTVSIAVESKYLKDFIVAFIYPNPSMGQFKVELSQEVTETAFVYDMTGNLLKQIEVDGDYFEVDINVPDGAYVLEILDAKELFLIENSIMTGYNK